MLFLLTNDDGIDAPGLQALAESVEHSAECVVVAPALPISECSHRVTTSEPIRVEERARNQFAVHGTPADCVRVAMIEICRDRKPDWVLSGINAGGNLGVDVFLSGTVAAAREATLFGTAAAAFSQYRRKGHAIDWAGASRRTRWILDQLIPDPLHPGEFWNVNLPHLVNGEPEPELVFCLPSQKHLPVQFRRENQNLMYVGNYQERDREPGSDVDRCFGGQVTVSRLHCRL